MGEWGLELFVALEVMGKSRRAEWSKNHSGFCRVVFLRQEPRKNHSAKTALNYLILLSYQDFYSTAEWFFKKKTTLISS